MTGLQCTDPKYYLGIATPKHYAVHCNISEREMKRAVLTGKNSLFVGNERGGRTAAILASLTSICRRHEVRSRLACHSIDRLTEIIDLSTFKRFSTFTARISRPDLRYCPRKQRGQRRNGARPNRILA